VRSEISRRTTMDGDYDDPGLDNTLGLRLKLLTKAL
jgi:hypothetical protein